MKNILLILTIILLFSCKKKEKDPEPVKDPSFTYGKTIELYYNQEIPVGAKVYIDDLVLTTKDFVGATKDTGRVDYPGNYISTTKIYNGATLVTAFDVKMQTAGKSLYLYLYDYNQDKGFKFTLTPTPYPNIASYIKFRISNPNGLKIKTENYPATITVIN